jgi:signal transduction histidine kinase
MTWFARLCGTLLLILSGGAMADETRGTAEEAQALVARAIAAYDAEGDAAFAAMNPPSTEFRDRDLYVFVIGSDNIVLVNGQDASRIGRDLMGTVDVTGRNLGKEIIENASQEGAWVDYVWRDPLTETNVHKTSWIVRHDGYIFGCGVYKP